MERPFSKCPYEISWNCFSGCLFMYDFGDRIVMWHDTPKIKISHSILKMIEKLYWNWKLFNDFPNDLFCSIKGYHIKLLNPQFHTTRWKKFQAKNDKTEDIVVFFQHVCFELNISVNIKGDISGYI